jgi:hypothetical protein
MTATFPPLRTPFISVIDAHPEAILTPTNQEKTGSEEKQFL